MTNEIIQSALRTFELEAQAIENLKNQIDNSFVEACNLILACTGRTVVVGLGKSGHIGKKIAATLASTGTPSFYVHATEASHGDLGMITQDDVVIAISNSGKTAELNALVPMFKRRKIPVIALTGNSESPLAKEANVSLNIGVGKEACPLNLAPTSSTTATLAMGDALAIALLETRGFSENDFAISHPGGTLGKKLLMHVSDVMVSGSAIPKVSEDATVKDALLEMTAKGLGMTSIVNQSGEFIGLFTDGDLRRAIDTIDVNTTTIMDVATTNCITTTPNTLAVDALNVMDSKHINGLFVLDESQQVVGALNMHTLFQSGLV